MTSDASQMHPKTHKKQIKETAVLSIGIMVRPERYLKKKMKCLGVKIKMRHKIKMKNN